MSLLQIGPQEDVMDLGCGTGHFAAEISRITSGQVVGIDPSPEMIGEARSKYSSDRISFEVGDAENLAADQDFDVIFCNSALQWFQAPARALAACKRALRPRGRMGVQAPARHDYCPNFLKGIEDVARHPETSAVFSRFRSPWFFCDTADAYAEIFRETGFTVPFARIETTSGRYSSEQVLKVFESGAAAGYLNEACYEGSLPEGYAESFRRVLADSFRAHAGSDGFTELLFYRIYLVAVTPD